MEDQAKYRELDVATVLDVPGEQIHVAKRQHWFVLAQQLVTLFFLCLVFSSLIFLAYLFIHISALSVFFYLLFIILATSTIFVKVVIDWYCHLYIVTDKKLIDVFSSPLFSNRLNGVFLDQVRITEVDANRDGMLSELLDIGSVTITFDRPTHQQEFVFENITNSEEVCILLSEILIGGKNPEQNYLWTKREDNANGFFFTEEIYPKVQKGAL